MKPLEFSPDFQGVRTDFAPTKLPSGVFQEDHGGDRYKTGSWRRRRGMRHTDRAKLSSAITSMIGFEMPGGDFALVAVNGTAVNGYVNVEQQG